MHKFLVQFGKQQPIFFKKLIYITMTGENKLINVISLSKLCLVPEVKNADTKICDESDFTEFRSLQVTRLQNLLVLAGEISLQNSSTDLKEALTTLFMLFGENNKIYPWNNEEMINMCHEIKADLLSRLNSSETIILEKGLVIKEELEMRPLLRDIFHGLRPKLCKETWKHYPAAVECFSWILESVKPISLSAHMPNALPMALLLVDDFIDENKIIGVKCISRILDAMTIAELKCHGFGQLIYKALERLLREREISVTSLTLPCLVKLLSKLEANLSETRVPYEWSPIDDAMEVLFEIIIMEYSIKLKQLYFSYLPLIIKILNSKVYRWTTRIVQIFDNYLEDAGKCKDYEIILNAFRAMDIFIKQTSKVRPELRPDLSFQLLRIVYHIHDDDESVEKAEAMKRAKDLLTLLYADSSEANTKKFKLDVLAEVSLNPVKISYCLAIKDLVMPL